MKSTRENRQLGEKSVPVPLCPPKISHGSDLGSKPGLRGERPATNRLSHGTAIMRLIISVMNKKMVSMKASKFLSSKINS
jgi:hypothetical protein